MLITRRHLLTATAALGAVMAMPRLSRAAAPSELRVDWATYNPLSILIRDQKLLEKEFEKDGIAIVWVQSAGSNKALEFLNAGSLDFGSTAGAAALVARSNGNPTKLVGVFSRPEWTALVTGKDSPVKSVADLKDRSVAVTRGTDPHIFLVRSLAEAGLTEKDVRVVPLQHADGRLALQRGDVDAWAGLDPMMAAAELDDGAVLFHRNPAINTWGVINVREDFAAENPDIVRRVLAVYEAARQQALADPSILKPGLVAAAKLPEAVIERQLSRTDLSHRGIGEEQATTILDAGKALQAAGIIKPEVDVTATVEALIDPSFSPAG